MAFKMKGWSGYQNSPAKQSSEKIGPEENPDVIKQYRKDASEVPLGDTKEEKEKYNKEYEVKQQKYKDATKYQKTTGNETKDFLESHPGFWGNSDTPAKQKSDTTKTYPKGYTKKDIEFLKKQREDVVRYEDLDAKGKAIWKKQGKPIPKKKKSPLKQDRPVEVFEKKGDTKKEKSPTKQTESGKGNIFTKKGRNQRAINKYKKARKKYFTETTKWTGEVDEKSKTSKKAIKYSKKVDKTYNKLGKLSNKQGLTGKDRLTNVAHKQEKK